MKRIVKKLKGWVKGQALKLCVAASVAMTALAGTALAAEGDAADGVEVVTTALTTGVQSFAGKAIALVGVLIVAAIPLAGALWLARNGFKWFKSMGK